jgi:polysaccharide export outer membrane protein
LRNVAVPSKFPALARSLLLAALCVLPAGCAELGSYTWYSDLPRSEWSTAPSEYVIGVGDTISIKVFDQEGLTTHGKIRSDGRIAMAFVGEIVAAGKTPMALARELEGQLKVFIVSPRVIVNVDDTLPIQVSMLGEVGNKGTLTLSQPATLLQALAQAGGLSEFADKDAIFVMRQQPTFRRIRFTYEALLNNKGGAAAFPVRAGDVIVVQ